MKQEGRYDFSAVNNSEHAPETCNEFVTVYLSEMKPAGLQKQEAIDLTRNLCHWLFDQSFTCSRISMIK